MLQTFSKFPINAHDSEERDGGVQSDPNFRSLQNQNKYATLELSSSIT